MRIFQKTSKKLNVVMNACNPSTQVLAPGCGNRVTNTHNPSTQALVPGKVVGRSRVMKANPGIQALAPGHGNRVRPAALYRWKILRTKV